MENELITEATTPTEEAQTEPTTTEEAETVAQETEEVAEGNENNAETITETPAEEELSLRYNHKDVKVLKSEAVRLAQMGKNYEENLMPLLNDLDYFATLQGKSVKELVKELVDGVENSYREELIEQFGADNPLIEEMLELRRGKNKKNYEAAKADREAKEKAAFEEQEKSTATKLAEQFEGLRSIFPEYDAIEKVPDSVIKRAVESGDLEKELLRYEKSERNKIEAAKASEEKNKLSNVGSAQSTPTEDTSINAFMKGLWG
jgi:hypothetical protein